MDDGSVFAAIPMMDQVRHESKTLTHVMPNRPNSNVRETARTVGGYPPMMCMYLGIRRLTKRVFVFGAVTHVQS